MSRTYRKQSGDQWWKSKSKYTQEYTFLKEKGYWIRLTYAKSWDEVEKDMLEATIRNEKKDGHNWDSISQAVKWHSNKMVRQGNRREIHRVMKDPENYDYNRDHDMRKRGLWWVYD
ncbi:hypothetical protein [Salmonella phage GSW6]|uniref:Uncharacterized protein n=1 Tax=Salmonella phage GSW6 TaxID=3025422 RepID=A0AAE9YMM6_9CAUD|nr:hypothetical protein [Salmonella phage GSW6]